MNLFVLLVDGRGRCQASNDGKHNDIAHVMDARLFTLRFCLSYFEYAVFTIVIITHDDMHERNISDKMPRTQSHNLNIAAQPTTQC